MNKKLLIWCSDAPNQMALAGKIAKKYTLSGIVIEKKKPGSSKNNFFQLPAKLWDRIRFRSIYTAWKKLLEFYKKEISGWPAVPILEVESINSIEAAEFSKRLSPDLIIVSGTRLIKEPLLSIPAGIGIVNLHTGLSPYVKGGPNCTNWCIANNDWHLVGNTIMWINAGIDTGNIITTESIDIWESKTLYDAHKMVMDHAHELYLKTIEYLLTSKPPHNSVGQSSLAKGKTYYTKMWTSKKKSELLFNWDKRKNVLMKPAPQTVSLPAFNQLNDE